MLAAIFPQNSLNMTPHHTCINRLNLAQSENIVVFLGLIIAIYKKSDFAKYNKEKNYGEIENRLHKSACMKNAFF